MALRCSPPFNSLSSPVRYRLRTSPPKPAVPWPRPPSYSTLPPNPRLYSTRTLPLPSLRKPFLFCAGLGALSLAGAAIVTNLDSETRAQSLARFRWRLGDRDVESALARSRLQDLIDKARAFISAFPSDLRWPTILAESYVNTSEAQRTCLGIIAIQAGVFAIWHIPAMRGVTRFLWHDPLQPGRTVTMLTSVFSHKGTMHLAFNSIALYSFGPSVINWLQAKLPRQDAGAGARSTSRYEFLGFFVAAGLFASLTSHIWSVRVLLPRLKTVLPSLGASGALYACLSVTALAYPEASVSLIFLPFFPIPIGTAFWGMVSLDVFGLIRGWRLFDHAAHLGGAVAGVLYFFYGHSAFERFRAFAQRYTIPLSANRSGIKDR